jgi:hypothetical protein
MVIRQIDNTNTVGAHVLVESIEKKKGRRARCENPGIKLFPPLVGFEAGGSPAQKERSPVLKKSPEIV